MQLRGGAVARKGWHHEASVSTDWTTFVLERRPPACAEHWEMLVHFRPSHKLFAPLSDTRFLAGKDGAPYGLLLLNLANFSVAYGLRWTDSGSI